MNTDSTIVIVGAGLAGTEAAFALRDGGHEGRIVMIGREAWPPYDRPPLSKSFLKGELPRDRLWLRPAKSYADEQIELQLCAEVVSIDRTERRVCLNTGTTLDYGKLLLATGGEARRLTIPGADLDGVCELKSLDDADRLRAGLLEGRSVVVIGGGYVGMEFAATACQAGCKVTVLESQARVLSRSLSATVAQYLQAEYANRGVRILTGASVTRIEGEGRVDAVWLKDGTRLPADVVLVSVGNQASDALARNDGLQVDRGIVVDREGRTNDPHVFAAGDCT
ncbi:MAG: FAD-dependent oxidoreductase, partial [Comamonadaceae bacterium]